MDVTQQFTQPFAARNNALPQLSPFGQPSANSCGLQSVGITPLSSTRKRSRDDVESEEEDYFPKTATPSIEGNDEWDSADGTTLQRKTGSFNTQMSSQTGSWADEQLKQTQVGFPSTPSIDRPVLRANKSQRLDRGDHGSAPNSSPTRQSPVRQVPTIDNFTLHLGIGWSRISEDSDMQAAARGWAKHIENHFPITAPRIALKSAAHESYLVEAREGYFLLHEDLKQGRFVASTIERAFENLKGPQPVFDSDEILNATANTPPVQTLSEVAPVTVDEPHVYAASQARRKEFLQTLGEGAGEGLRGATAFVSPEDTGRAYAIANGVGFAGAGQAPAVEQADEMDMS